LTQPPGVEKRSDSPSASRRSEQLSPRDARFPRKPDREETGRRALARVIAAEHTQNPSEPVPERRIYPSIDQTPAAMPRLRCPATRSRSPLPLGGCHRPISKHSCSRHQILKPVTIVTIGSRKGGCSASLTES
jgi:hypothetical protein